MNKAFVKEIDADARVMCPKCGTIGIAVGKGPLDTHVRTEARSRISDSAWCCGNSDCSVVYFNLFDQTVTTDELNTPVYPYNLDAPICQCFGFTYDDVDHDSRDVGSASNPGTGSEIKIPRRTLPGPCRRWSMLPPRSAATLSQAPIWHDSRKLKGPISRKTEPQKRK